MPQVTLVWITVSAYSFCCFILNGLPLHRGLHFVVFCLVVALDAVWPNTALWLSLGLIKKPVAACASWGFAVDLSPSFCFGMGWCLPTPFVSVCGVLRVLVLFFLDAGLFRPMFLSSCWGVALWNSNSADGCHFLLGAPHISLDRMVLMVSLACCFRELLR